MEAAVEPQAKRKRRTLPRGIYIRGKAYWYQYKGCRGPLGVPVGVKGVGLREAKIAYAYKVKEITHELIHGKEPEAIRHTLRQLFEKYFEQHASARPSAETARVHQETFEEYFGGNTLLSNITSEEIIQYKTERINEDGVTAATANREINTLKAAFNWGVRQLKWLPVNPCAGIGTKEGEDVERHRPYTVEQEAALLKASPPWLQAIITFLINTGLRPSEAWRLQWPSVDLNQRALIVESLDSGRHSKNAERRVVPLNDAALAVLKARMKSAKTRLVFYTQAHTAHENSNIRRAFLAACEAAKVGDKPRVYDLRHTFGTRMVQRGVDLYTVQVLMGHKSPKMTQRYAKHNVESLRRGVDALVTTVNQ